MEYVSFPYGKISIGVLIFFVYFSAFIYAKRIGCDFSIKYYLRVCFIFVILEFFLIVDPILDYNCAVGESSIWYSGYITDRNYKKNGIKLVDCFDTLGKKREMYVWNAGKTNSYVLFSKEGYRTSVIKKDILIAVRKYCEKGVKKEKRHKVFFLLELDKYHIYDASSQLGRDVNIVSAVVEKRRDGCFYNTSSSDDLIWYNENDDMSQNGDSILIMYDKKDRIKYNIYKKNPSKGEFDRYKFSSDF